MKIVALLALAFVSEYAVGAPTTWVCDSIDAIGLSYEKGSWRSQSKIQPLSFELSIEASDRTLRFPTWLMMDEATCVENTEVPWISCSTGFKQFVFNPATGDAVMTNAGLWVLKESMKSKGLPLPPLGADLTIFRCL